jgi:hypothetical protein
MGLHKKWGLNGTMGIEGIYKMKVQVNRVFGFSLFVVLLSISSN